MRTLFEVMCEWESLDPAEIERFLDGLGEDLSEIPLHVVDQVNAAAEDLESFFPEAYAKAKGGKAPRSHPVTSQTGRVLPMFVVFLAMSQRGMDLNTHACEHLVNPQITYIELGVRRINCEECHRLLIAIQGDTPEDDGLCDFCQRPAKTFYEWTMGYLAVIVHGDICKECRNGLRRMERLIS